MHNARAVFADDGENPVFGGESHEPKFKPLGQMAGLVERVVAVDSALFDDSNRDVDAQSEPGDNHRCANN